MSPKVHYSCSFCGKSFDEESDCKAHEAQIHRCPVRDCDAIFVRGGKTDRKRHIEQAHPRLRAEAF